MPLLMLTGHPAAGKTKWAQSIRKDFESRIAESKSSLTVVLLNDELLDISKNDYLSSNSEKKVRGLLFSAVERHLSKDCIVICDALNYIKGFRYQLSCAAKALSTPHCLVHIGTPPEQCLKFNVLRQVPSPNPYSSEEKAWKYDDQVISELLVRYEEPQASTRWDSPLFTIPYTDTEEMTDFEGMWNALVNSSVKRPNAATLTKPAVSSDYLYELDKITQSIVTLILDNQKMGMSGGTIPIPKSGAARDGKGRLIGTDKAKEVVLRLPSEPIGIASLQRLRRTFISMQRNMMAFKVEQIGDLFAGYLNEQWE